MQFGEISEKVGGNDSRGEGTSGGRGQCSEGIQRRSDSQRGSMVEQRMGALGVEKPLVVEAEASYGPVTVCWCGESGSL